MQADKERRMEEERFRNLFESVNDAIFIIDMDGNFIDINKTAYERLGYTREEMLSMSIPQVDHPDFAAKIPEHLEELRHRGTAFFESAHKKKDGTILPVEVNARVIEYDGRQVILSAVRDITERRRAEEALRESEEKFRAIVQTTTEWIWEINAAGTHTFSNPAVEKILGYRVDEIVERNALDLICKDDQAKVRGLLVRDHAEKKGWAGLVLRWQHKDGGLRYLESNATPVLDARGEVLGYRGSDRDITERMRIEELQRESEEKYRLLVETANSVILRWDTDGNILFVNEYAKRFFGFSGEELIGKNVVGTIVPETESSGRDLALLMQAIRRDPDRFMDNENENITKDGRRIWIRWANKAIVDQQGRLAGILSVGNDITERKRAEEALRKSEERYRSLYLRTPVMLHSIDPEGRLLSVSDEWLIKMEYSRDEVLGRRSTEFLTEASRHYAMESVLPDFFQTGICKNVPYQMVTRNGKILDVLLSATAEYDETGSINRSLAVIEDITERKRAEKALIENTVMLHSISDNLPGIMIYQVVRDNDGSRRFTYVSETVKRFYGCTPEEALADANRIYGMVHEEDRMRVRSEEEAANAALSPLETEVRMKSPDGEYRWSHFSSRPRRLDGGETCWDGVEIDITERKKTEDELNRHRKHLEELVEQRSRELSVVHEQLRQSQKLEAVGLLAGGIAHDFSNILAAIKGSMYLIQKKLEKDSPLMQYADQVVSSVSRANNLTQGLLAFSRRQLVVLKPRGINGIVHAMAGLISRVIGEHVELYVELTDKAPAVMADRNQIEQVLLNLATNARDAMPDGGRLTIRTDLIRIEDSFRREHGFGVPGRYAEISVSDTGIGIEKDIQEKLFEPFFTTKVVGKGSGLGLAVTYGIVKQHNGFITAESSREKGTTFRILIPAIEADTVQPEETPEFPGTMGMETILFAEDDADARATTAEILRMTGYTVLEAQDGEEALNVFEENKERIRLAFLDVRMPGKDGRGVYEAIRNSGSDIRFLFISGYTADILDDTVISGKNVDFISKIAQPDEILNKIREILDR